MASTYIEAVGTGFPSVQCHTLGDGTIYEDIIWDGGAPMPSKEALDAWIAANAAPAVDMTKITVLAFRNRFTQTEKITIDMASLDNPAAPMPQRQLAAMLRVMNADIATATFIDLDRPDTVAGVNALEQYGIIGAGRAHTILTTIPTAVELYRE